VNRRDLRRRRALCRLYVRAGVALSQHAVERAAEHGFSEDDVLLAVVAPEQTYTCPADRYGPDRRMCQRGPIAVVVDQRRGQVVTVLPRVEERWEHPAPLPRQVMLAGYRQRGLSQ
jgi:hypothetical protein